MYVKTDGQLMAAGYNGYGRLGDGTTTDRHTPVVLASMGTDNAAASAGNHHTVYLKTDGRLMAAGENDCGQLGDRTTTNRRTPVVLAWFPKAFTGG